MTNHLKKSISNLKNLKWRTLCVIEPSAEACTRLKLYFETFGVKVFTVSHFDKVANTLEGASRSGTPVDLILVETRFPEITGVDMLKEIQSVVQHADVPLFVMSSGYSSGELSDMVRWGVRGYLKKPVKVDEIGAFIAERI